MRDVPKSVRDISVRPLSATARYGRSWPEAVWIGGNCRHQPADRVSPKQSFNTSKVGSGPRKTEQPETIESRFANVRHWTDRTKGCLTRDGMLAMIYKLGLCAGRRWRRLRGFESCAKIVDAVKFRDGVEVHNVVHGH